MSDGKLNIDLNKYVISDYDLERFTCSSFDLHREVINNACAKIANLNEKRTEQALIIKLNNHIKKLEAEIERLRATQKEKTK